MIRIEERKNLKLVISTVSDFCDSMGYCEHKIPFHIESIKPPPSVETIQGSIAHETEEKIEKELTDSSMEIKHTFGKTIIKIQSIKSVN